MLSPFLQHCCNTLFSPLASRGPGSCARADCCHRFTFRDLVPHPHIKRFVCFKKACAVTAKECIKSGVNKLNWCEGLIGFGGRGVYIASCWTLWRGLVAWLCWRELQSSDLRCVSKILSWGLEGKVQLVVVFYCCWWQSALVHWGELTLKCMEVLEQS